MKKTSLFLVNALLLLAFLTGISMILIDINFSLWILGGTFIVFLVKQIIVSVFNEKKSSR